MPIPSCFAHSSLISVPPALRPRGLRRDASVEQRRRRQRRQEVVAEVPHRRLLLGSRGGAVRRGSDHDNRGLRLGARRTVEPLPGPLGDHPAAGDSDADRDAEECH